MSISQFLSAGDRKSMGRYRAFLIAIVTSLVAAMCVVVQPVHAQESCSGGSYSNLHWKDGSPGVKDGVYSGRYDQAQVEFDWQVPDTARKGDKFTIKLPDQLVTVNTGKLELKDSVGQVVAEASIIGNSKMVEFVLTDFADKRFEVKGKAFFTVEWDRGNGSLPQNGFGDTSNSGDLIFDGCGKGTLKGFYLPDGPAGITHESGKSGRYSGPYETNGKTNYLFDWNIFVGSKTGTSEFSVTDTPPTGHKFACDSEHVMGRWSPIIVDATTEAGPSQTNVIQIPGGIQHTGTHNLTLSEHAKKQQWDSVQYLGPHGFHIDCRSDSVTVRFPYGVDPNTGPRISLITYTDEEPSAGSRITNKALVGGREVEATVVIPAAGGWAEGKFGGFAFRKQSEGLDSEPEKIFGFEWTCHHKDTPEKETGKGEKSLKSGESHHVSDQDKGTICRLKETNADIEGYERITKWTVNGKPQEGESIEVEASASNEQAAIIEVTNTYTKKEEKPKDGSFKIIKKVEGLDGNTKANAYLFDYKCSLDGKVVKSNDADKLIKIEGAGEQTIEGIPAGATCSVTENEESAQVADYTVEINDKNTVIIQADKTVDLEVTNKYTTSLGKFRVTKKVDGLPESHKDVAYDFTYTCVKDSDVKSGKFTITGTGEETIDKIPAGYFCSVEEDEEKAAVKGYSLVTNISGPVTIAAGQTQEITVNNVYSQNKGSFSITKELQDPDNVAAGKKFSFDYVCENKDLGFKTNGTVGPIGAGEKATVKDIPEGSICTIKEQDAQVGDSDLKVSGLDESIIVGNGEKNVKVTNAYSAWRAKITLSKEITGSTSKALMEKPFKVNYVCELGSWKKDGTVTVTAKTPTVIQDLRSGAECVFTENTEGLDVGGARFNPAGSTTTVTVKVGGKGTNASAKLVNDYKELGKVSLTKVIGGLSADAWGSSGQNPREFDVEVTYKDATGVNKTQTLKISEGKNTELPALPVGTEIKVREVMPRNSALTTWSTPGYSSADGSAVVRDNGDGSATIIVPSDSFDKPALVKVRNTANIPWWWSLLILVPFVAPHLVPSDSGSSSSSTPTNASQKPAAPITQKSAPVKEKPKKALAVTGASVYMMLALGVVLTLAGLAFFVMRHRRD
ncbi:peptidase [Corynebacterium ulcerans]|uniref:DUF5979 domain-containing protein n=2 Tax=Corynebacterium ulcerans TaxID=65058 RepID=UPI001305221A|nr:DUF5979 domain-containing protein [Corynebacterium ulcerans]MBH5302388.1 peptidase [Corynebacterium ulcerans]NOL57949.1 peptidase [Corynebacterium ulcerans]NOM02580.1 peptidase [Corynebacterium ulcerans]